MSSPLGFNRRPEPLGEIRHTPSAESGSAPADGATQCAGIREARGTHVPSGYKRTEVGVVPEDWGVQSLKSMLGEPPSYGINAPAVPFDGSLPTYIRITDIGEGGRFRPTPRVSVNGARGTLCFLRPGDLVFARTGASVGKSYLYDPRDGPLVFAGFLIRIAPDPNQLRSEYIAQYVQTRSYWNWIANNSARSGQPGINAWEYGSLPVPLPPLPEQRAIAAVLTDADALIGSLEALIAKKRAIKRAAMQRLLTGRTRLPGFEGEWGTGRLGEVATIAMGRTPSRDVPAYWGGEHVWLSVSDLKDRVVTESRERITDLAAVQMQAVPAGTLLMSFKLSIGRVGFAGCSLYTNEAICSLTRLSCHADYLYYALQEVDFSLYGRQAVKGQTLNSESLSQVQVPFPPLPEQRAIAAVLTDMDAEIAALERRLDKTRAVKLGMMQQLLTGAIRLPIPEAAGESEPSR